MKNNQTLFEKLYEYGKSDMYPFHMPGHKRRLGPEESINIYQMDITEIEGFDNLHQAENLLKDAQDFAAKCFHSEETHFLINGSTSGLLSAIAGVCDDGDTILVARNCHHAVYHAIELHHLNPVYIYPDINKDFGVYEGISVDDVERILNQCDDVKAVVITSPTYDGVVSDIASMCHVAHSRNIPVIVDEAHGSHFHYSEYFPKSAIECGADVVIQSTHKTMPAMTQTALIHLNGEIIDRKRIRRMLAVYQTSSPSYILMGSIDSSIHLLQRDGTSLYKTYTDHLQWLRKEIESRCQHIKLLGIQNLNSQSSFDYDCSKLVLSVKGTNLSGVELYELLLNQYHLQMEMVSESYVLAMTSVGDEFDGFERLLNALVLIDQKIEKTSKSALYEVEKCSLNQKMSIYDVFHVKHPWKRVDVALNEAVGHIAAEYIYLYPPGVPLIVPGEEVTEIIVKQMKKWIQKNLRVTGVINNDSVIEMSILIKIE